MATLGGDQRVKQSIEKDYESIVPRIGFVDMDETMQQNVFAICKEAYKKLADGECKYFKDMATHIKKKMDDTYSPGSYHVIVGKPT